ncbi:MAG: nickel/cobalt transporter [Casimicrobiaceae bacterium]
MPRSISSELARWAAAAAALVVLSVASLACRADTVASLLGNFTINQYCGVRLDERTLGVHYAVVFGQLPALRELHLADADGDGVTTEAERDAYARHLAPRFADRFEASVNGVAVPLHAVRWTTSLPTEQGGFSLRLDVDFSGALPPSSGNRNHVLRFANRNYAGRFGWQEIVVETVSPISAFDTNAFSTSLTAGLTQALRALPANGPLAERSVHLTYTDGPAPAGARMLQPRPGTALARGPGTAPPGGGTTMGATGADAAGIGATGAAIAWLTRETRRLVELISTPHVPLHIALLALLAAAVLGAFHAFSPGHGKTVVGAYLIGSRGTPRHALFLGLTVTVTHTLGVFALGFATLIASRFVVPERLFPILSLVSGLLVLGMGIVLLVQRWRAARNAFPASGADRAGRLGRSHAAATVVRYRTATLQASSLLARRFAFAQGHELDGSAHDHSHDHDGHAPHEHEHAHGHHGPAAALTHSHGGRVHSHLPPDASGERLSWQSLLALGVSGGLVPCPSAMVLLLAAVALNKTAYGLVLVLAFSVGLAATLTAVGLAFLYARNRIVRPGHDARWPHWLPVASAGAITLVGAMMCYGAVVASPL